MNIQIHADLAGVLRKARNQNFPLQTALMELVDNSIDAEASIISIREDNGDLVITDNGKGFDDIASALVVGKSAKSESIGRYGVGLKDACVRYSDATLIRSRGMEVVAPWRQIVTGSHDGNVSATLAESDGNTVIILESFRDRYTQPIQTGDICRTYAPLIDSKAIVIDVNGIQLKPSPLPKFTESIDETFDFRGKKARIYGGIFLPSDENRKAWAGYNPFYKGRMIGPGKITNMGVGEEGCTHFAFVVELIDGEAGWVLATNKDSVESLRELLEHCYDTYTAPLLKKGAEASRDIELRQIEDAVTKALNGGNQTRQRQSEPKQGTAAPTFTGKSKRNTFTATSTGRYQTGTRGNSKILFRFEDLQGDTLGEIQDHGKQLIVTANLNNPFVAENRTNEPVALLIAKHAYATHKRLRELDTVPGELVSGIMDDTGSELSFSYTA